MNMSATLLALPCDTSGRYPCAAFCIQCICQGCIDHDQYTPGRICLKAYPARGVSDRAHDFAYPARGWQGCIDHDQYTPGSRSHARAIGRGI